MGLVVRNNENPSSIAIVSKAHSGGYFRKITFSHKVDFSQYLLKKMVRLAKQSKGCIKTRFKNCSAIAIPWELLLLFRKQTTNRK